MLHYLDAKIIFPCVCCVCAQIRVCLQELLCRRLVRNISTLRGGLCFQWWQWAWIRGIDLVSCCCQSVKCFHIVSASSPLFSPCCFLFSSALSLFPNKHIFTLSFLSLSFFLCLQTSYLDTFRQVYTVGYATSLISLITAIVVFTAFR